MGVLIFAYRKLSLKRKINQDEFRSVMLSMEKQQVTSQINLMQQAMADKQDMAQQMIGNISNIFYAGTQMQNAFANQNVQGAENALREAMKKANNNEKDSDVVKAKENYDAAKNAAMSTQSNSMYAFNAFQTQMLGLNQQVNSIFMAKDKGALQGLKSKENRIDTEIANLNSVLAQEKAELQNVEKEEGEEAKNGAPKFGL